MPLPVTTSPAESFRTSRIEGAQRIFDAPWTLGRWHLASLDAPTVAVAWTMAFAWAGHVRLPLWIPLAVALVTWPVYVTDRLLDAWTRLREPERHRLRERHFFHWRHRRTLLPLAIAAACAAAGIVFGLMPAAARGRDSMLGIAALAYFSGVHSTRRPLLLRWPRDFPGKELLVGVLFTTGCAFCAWNRRNGLGCAAWDFRVPAAGFAALAWLNCTAIAQWEAMGGAPDKARPPIYKRRSPRWFGALALSLAALELILSALAAASHPRSAALLGAAAVSALLLALLDRAQTRIAPLALRAAADLVLLTPLPLLIFAWVRGLR